MAKEHILVVDDEEDILELVRYNLAKDGYNVTCVTSGEEGLKVARNEKIALVILDLMLPGVDGLDVCRVVKSDRKTKHLPIIMLTAKGEEADIVTGLELGADDYLVKPFSPRVLSARVKSVIRRRRSTGEEGGELLQLDELEINPGKHEVLIQQKPVELTYSEFRILHLLAKQPGWVFTRQQIVDAVHGSDYPVTDRSVDVQVVGLRRKLGKMGKHIETVRGVGYRYKG